MKKLAVVSIGAVIVIGCQFCVIFLSFGLAFAQPFDPNTVGFGPLSPVPVGSPLTLRGMTFTTPYSSPCPPVTADLSEDELSLLLPYNTPEKILELTQVVAGSEIFNQCFDTGPQIFNPDFYCRPIKAILENKGATTEEIVFLQAIALDLAGYERKLVIVPSETERGLRHITFVAYKKPDKSSWRAMENPAFVKYGDAHGAGIMPRILYTFKNRII